MPRSTDVVCDDIQDAVSQSLSAGDESRVENDSMDQTTAVSSMAFFGRPICIHYCSEKKPCYRV